MLAHLKICLDDVDCNCDNICLPFAYWKVGLWTIIALQAKPEIIDDVKWQRNFWSLLPKLHHQCWWSLQFQSPVRIHQHSSINYGDLWTKRKKQIETHGFPLASTKLCNCEFLTEMMRGRVFQITKVSQIIFFFWYVLGL